MTTGDVVYSLRFSLIKILPEPGFDLGSTAGESCVLTARLHMLYEITSKIDNNLIPTNIYIDLSKAFDTLNHSILLYKLKYYGVTGCANKLFQCYLSGRSRSNLLNTMVINQRNYMSLRGSTRIGLGTVTLPYLHNELFLG